MILLSLLLLAAPPDAEAAATTPAMPSLTPPTPTAATTKLQALRQLFDDLQCEKVIAAAPAIEDHRLATLDERLEASFRHAYCLVVLGNIGEASALFTTVLQEKVDANPPFEVEPRVQILIEAARAEEIKRRGDAEAEARRREVAKVSLEVRAPANLTGGNRALFYVDVTDPDALVATLRVEFRKQLPGTAEMPAERSEFFALPVVKQSEGVWRGEVPGAYTRSKGGMTLEWFISASDARGEPIKSVGSRDAPRTLVVAPGSAMALDLKANERLTQETRLALAVVGTPFMTAAGAAAGFALAFAGSLGNEVALLVGLAVLPPLAATFGTWIVASSYLDGVDIIFTVATTAAFGVVYTGAVLVAGGVSFDSEKGLVNSIIDNGSVPIYFGVGAAGLGIAVSAVLPTVLVALDAPAE